MISIYKQYQIGLGAESVEMYTLQAATSGETSSHLHHQSPWNSLDLSENYLTGEIGEFFTNMTSL